MAGCIWHWTTLMPPSTASPRGSRAVSYTHLDVYKRQAVGWFPCPCGQTPGAWLPGNRSPAAPPGKPASSCLLYTSSPKSRKNHRAAKPCRCFGIPVPETMTVPTAGNIPFPDPLPLCRTGYHTRWGHTGLSRCSPALGDTPAGPLKKMCIRDRHMVYRVLQRRVAGPLDLGNRVRGGVKSEGTEPVGVGKGDLSVAVCGSGILIPLAVSYTHLSPAPATLFLGSGRWFPRQRLPHGYQRCQ